MKWVTETEMLGWKMVYMVVKSLELDSGVS